MLFKGYTTSQIAEIFDKGQSSVQRDLTIRLKKLCDYDSSYQEFYDMAQERLLMNQTSTIEVNRKR